MFFTVAIPSVRSLNAYDVTSRTMRVRWEPVKGATGYMLLYEPVNATIPATEKEVTISSSERRYLYLLPYTQTARYNLAYSIKSNVSTGV